MPARVYYSRAHPAFTTPGGLNSPKLTSERRSFTGEKQVMFVIVQYMGTTCTVLIYIIKFVTEHQVSCVIQNSFARRMAIFRLSRLVI